MTPASSGIYTVTCSPLLRGVRPHVSLSEALSSAFASWGIPPLLSYGWHLLLRETTGVTSFLTFVLRVRRATLSPGFRGGEPGSPINMPSPKPCPFWTQPILQRSLVFPNESSTVCSLSTHRRLLPGMTPLESGRTRFSSRFTD